MIWMWEQLSLFETVLRSLFFFLLLYFFQNFLSQFFNTADCCHFFSNCYIFPQNFLSKLFNLADCCHFLFVLVISQSTCHYTFSILCVNGAYFRNINNATTYTYKGLFCKFRFIFLSNMKLFFFNILYFITILILTHLTLDIFIYRLTLMEKYINLFCFVPLSCSRQDWYKLQ